MTDSILISTLPATHAVDASNRIRDQFLKEELQYHFEDYELRYDIVVENGTAIIRQKVETNLVISPRHEAPEFTQEMQVDGQYELLELRINGDRIESKQLLKQDDSGLWTFSLPLKDFLTGAHAAADRSVRFERTYRITPSARRPLEPPLVSVIKVISTMMDSGKETI